MNPHSKDILKSQTCFFTILLLGLLFASGFLQSNHGFLVFAVDSQGNDITHVKAFENSTTSWVLVKNFTASGQSERIPDSVAFNFETYVRFNVSLAATNATAQSYTRVNITIQHGAGPTTDINNAAMANAASYSFNDSTYYYLAYYYNWTGLSIAGESYNCTCVYQGYY